MGIIFDWLRKRLMELYLSMIQGTLTLTSQSYEEALMFRFIIIILTFFAFVSLIIGLAFAIPKYATSDDRDIQSLVKNILFASLYAVSFANLSQAIYKFGYMLTKEISSIFLNAYNVVSANDTYDTIFEKAVVSNINMGSNILLEVAILVVVLVALVLVIFQQMKRAVDLLIYQIQGVLSVFSLVTGNTSGFNTYVKAVVSLTITQAIQIMFLYSGLITMQLDNSNFLIGVGFILASVNVSKKMDQWAYSSGVGGGMRAVANTAGSVAQITNAVSRIG